MDESGGTQSKRAQIDLSLCNASNSKYDVFLNHRGPETKYTFVSALEKALRQVAYKAFMDVRSLIEGQGAFSSMADALMGASVHVAIFSPRYAESKYCLNELCEIMCSGKPIIPIFYNIEPENLRQTDNGPFAEAFCKHVLKGRSEEVTKWKEALLGAASISGFKHVEHVNDMMELVSKVVARVMEALPLPPPLPVARHPVGMSESSSDVCNMFDRMGEHAGIVGICGMGGIGKTTLAKEVYNQNRSEFKYHCFVKDVKDCHGFARRELQERMVADLFHMELKDLPYNHEQRLKMIQEKKVLIVLDDICELDQFRDLIPNARKLSHGSRVIVTSRDSAILREIMSDVPSSQHELYYVRELDKSYSLELFIWCAFKKTSLSDVDSLFQNHVIKSTEACCGVPLALEIMGGYLRDQLGLEHWNEALSTLKSNAVIIGSLQISYKGLQNDDLRRMFVDIASLMLGYEKQKCLIVWEANGYDAPNSLLSILINKCLVKVDEKGTLCMHDLVRDMGREVVKELSRAKMEIPSHVWSAEEGEKLFKRRKEANSLVGLSLIGMEPSKVFNAQEFMKFSNLRYLLLDTCLVEGDFSMWSEELRWLQWKCYTHAQLPVSLKLPNLAVLDLSNSFDLREVWSKELECPFEELKILQLHNCTNLKVLPNNIKQCLKLKHVDIKGCWDLEELPESFCNLCNLEILDMTSCGKLQKLPPSFSKLTKLSKLVLEETSLMELPKDFGQLSSLRELILNECWNLEELPESFCNLCNLEILDMTRCGKFQKLPPSFSKLIRLSKLVLDGTSLMELPKDFGQLSSLKEVSFYRCKNLVELPESFGSLCNLEILELSWSEEFHRLPASFTKLIKLSKLVLDGTSLMELPKDFGQLSSLKEVSFHGCKNLVELPESFGSLCNLEILFMTRCGKLQSLPPSFSKLIKLSELVLEESSLIELPKDFGQLSSLKEVRLNESFNLVEIPESFGILCNLEILNMSWCKELKKLPISFTKVIKLSYLVLEGTSLMESPKDFGQLSSLKEVRLKSCLNLVELPESFGSLCNLEILEMSNCGKLQILPPSFSKLIKLSKLVLERTSLMELPKDFGQLSSLKDVSFYECENLVELPESFGSLCNLEILDMTGCGKLQSLPPSFSKLIKLSKLYFGGTSLVELTKDFGQLSSLKEVSFYGCKNLVELPESFCNLCNLEILDMTSCGKLQKLPPSFSKLTKLSKLVLGDFLVGVPKKVVQ